MNFAHYLVNSTIFDKKVLKIKYGCRFSLQISCKIFLIVRIIERELKKNCIVLHIKWPLLLSDFNEP